METALIGPAQAFFLFIPTVLFSLIIPVAGIVIFTYIMATRLAPLVKAAPDDRLNRYPERIYKVLKIWLAQWRQPRCSTHPDIFRISRPEHQVNFPGYYRTLRWIRLSGI